METVSRPTRKSLPLSERDLRELATLRNSPSHQAALDALAGSNIKDASSEAAVLHAVWEAGLNAVLERVEEQGYQQMAAERDLGARKAVSRRRQPLWADES